jgi:hypothetical protein
MEVRAPWILIRHAASERRFLTRIAEHRFNVRPSRFHLPQISALLRKADANRDASWVVHLLPDILRACIFAIACGYEDADDPDRLRFDSAQASLWPLTRYRPGPLLAADRLALGKCAVFA